MTLWIETIAVILLAILGAVVGYWLGRRSKAHWIVGYVVGLLLLVAVGIVKWNHMLTFARPGRWVAWGRREFVFLSVGAAVVLGTLLPRLPTRRIKVLVCVLMILAVGGLCVPPFLGPALVWRRLSDLQTVIDPDGVCV